MTDTIEMLKSTSAWVWTASWQATAIAGCVLLAQWALRRQLSARWRNALWLLVFARLLMPALPPAPCSVYNWLPAKPPAAIAQPEAPVEIPQPPAMQAPPAPVAPQHFQAAAAAIPPANPAPVPVRQPLPLLSMAWAAGVVAALVSGMADYARMQRRVKRLRQPVPAGLKDAFEEAKRVVRIRRVDLMVSEAVATPLVTGAWRARIILPAGLELPAADLRMVLLHELAHVKRGDLWVAWLACVAGAVHWFNPAIWFALARARRDREMACDESVLRFVADASAYGAALVRFLESRQSPVQPLGVIGIFESKASLLQRIRRIAAYRRPTVLGSMIGMALLAVALAMLTGAGANPSAPAADVAAATPAWPIDHAAQPLVIHCVDADGHPVQNAEVYLQEWHGNFGMYQYDSTLPVTATGPLKTDATGDVKIDHPITFNGGKFRREAYARLPGKLVGGDFWESDNPSSPQSPGGGASVVIHMKPTSPLRGRVHLESGGDPRTAIVTLMGWAQGRRRNFSSFDAITEPSHVDPWSPLFEKKPDRDGFFEFQDVPGEGTVSIAATAPGFAEMQHRTQRGEDMPFELDLPPESVIQGRAAFQATGKPAAGIRVYANWRGDDTGMAMDDGHPAITGTDGAFRIGGLRGGDYMVSAARSPDWTVEPVLDVKAWPHKPGTADLKLEPGAFLTGKVTEKGTGAPLKGFGLAAVVADDIEDGLDSAFTDANGEYRLRIPTGRSMIYVGVIPDDDFTLPREQSRTVTVADGKVSDASVDFVLTRIKGSASPAPATKAVDMNSVENADTAWPIQHAAEPLVIRCVDENEHPVPNAEVYLVQWHGGIRGPDSLIPITPTGPLITDAKGEVSIANPIIFDHGNFRRQVFARVPGKLVGGIFAFGSDYSGEKLDEAEKSLLVKMVPSGPIRGRVQFASGANPSSATVDLLSWLTGFPYAANLGNQFGTLGRYGQPEPWPQFVQRTPGHDGWFEFDDVPRSGLLYFSATAPGSGEAQYMTNDDLRDPFTMVLEPESVIVGRAIYAGTGKPAAGMEVDAYPKSMGRHVRLSVTHSFPAITGTDGAFRIEGMPEGLYTVAAMHPDGWAVEPQNASIAPDVTGTVNLVLEQGALVTGSAVEADSRAPIAGVMVGATTPDANGQWLDSAVTDKDGQYRMRLPSGKTNLYLMDVGTGLYIYPRNQGRRVVTVVDGQVMDGSLDFTIARSSPGIQQAAPASLVQTGSDAQANGRVIDQQGKPVSDVDILATGYPLKQDEFQSGARPRHARTGADGTYVVPLDAFSDYRIAAGGPAYSTASSAHIKTGSGTTHHVEDLVIRPALSSAAGVVIDGAGRPVADVDLDARCNEKMSGLLGEPTCVTGSDGRFQIPHLMEDSFFDLALEKPGYVRREIYTIPPGVQDLRVKMLREPGGPPQEKDYSHWLANGKRLIGGPAPSWDVAEWIQKEDPTPGPKRADGRWTLLYFERGGDADGDYLHALADVAARTNVVPVMIYQSHFDEHLPRMLLQKKPNHVTVGMDRYIAGSDMDPQGTEQSATRVAYGDQDAYLIDPNGIVRGATTGILKAMEAVMGKAGGG